MRVFSCFYSQAPLESSEVVADGVAMEAFFPLQAAVNRQIVTIVGNIKVPENLKEFPVFRAGMVNPSTGKVKDWWLWNGEDEWRVGSLSDEQRNLPIRGIWNDTLLIQRIESGWRPALYQT